MTTRYIIIIPHTEKDDCIQMWYDKSFFYFFIFLFFYFFIFLFDYLIFFSYSKIMGVAR